MTSTYDISNKIVSFLKTKLRSVKDIKATPEAVFAPTIYDLTGPDTIVLVWYDSTAQHIDSRPRQENGNPVAGSFISKHLRFVVSIGFRSMSEAPNMDKIIEAIELNLTNYDIPGIAPLKPSGISRITVDPNKVYWRQIWFDTIDKLDIAIHTN